MHATSEEARLETQKMLHVYEDLQKNYMAIPTLVGRKTNKEKFAGAEETYTCENIMYDGVALQNGTSHYFGDGFAQAFDIKYLDKENNLIKIFNSVIEASKETGYNKNTIRDSCSGLRKSNHTKYNWKYI